MKSNISKGRYLAKKEFDKIQNLSEKNLFKEIDLLIKNAKLRKQLQVRSISNFYLTHEFISKKIDKLLAQAKFIEFALTNTELESLLHEQYLIKELNPKFNVQFKDDKGYPWIKIDSKKNFSSC